MKKLNRSHLAVIEYLLCIILYILQRLCKSISFSIGYFPMGLKKISVTEFQKTSTLQPAFYIMFPLTKGCSILMPFQGLQADFGKEHFWALSKTILKKRAHFLETDETESVHNVGDETYLKGQKVEDIKISFV